MNATDSAPAPGPDIISAVFKTTAGKYQTLEKVRNNLSQILRYAIDQEIPDVEVDLV